jgi:hypothetical protein
MTIRIGDPSHYGDAKIGGATIIDTTNTRNIGDATTPMVARVYASDAPLKPAATVSITSTTAAIGML